MAEGRGWIAAAVAGGIVLAVFVVLFGMVAGVGRGRDGRGRFSLGDTSTSTTTALRQSPVTKRRKTADGLALEDGAAFVEQRRARAAENTPGGENEAEGRGTRRAASQLNVDGYKDVSGSGERLCTHCKEKGHYITTCPKRQRCRQCQGKGHAKNYCPELYPGLLRFGRLLTVEENIRMLGIPEVLNRKPGEPLSYDLRKAYLRILYHQKAMGVGDPVKKVAQMVGASEGTIRQLYNEFERSGKVALWADRRSDRTFNTTTEWNAFVIDYVSKQHRAMCRVRTKKLQKEMVREFNRFFSLRYVRALCKRLGFGYKEIGGHKIVVMTPNIHVRRYEYLRERYRIRKAEKEPDKKVVSYWLDESYVHQNHVSNFTWYRPGDEVPHPDGYGKRWCIIGCGSRYGWLEPPKVFQGDHKLADYHGSMNARHFEEWARGAFRKMREKDPEGEIHVHMDNAAYHIAPVEGQKRISQLTKKADLAKAIMDMGTTPYTMEQLTARKTKTGGGFTVKDLRKLLQELGYQPERFIDKLALEFDIYLHFLPPYHPKLNPIELAWARAKNRVAENNESRKFADVKVLLEEGFALVDAAAWERLVIHAEKEEDEYRRQDATMVIHIDDDDEEEAALVPPEPRSRSFRTAEMVVDNELESDADDSGDAVQPIPDEDDEDESDGLAVTVQEALDEEFDAEVALALAMNADAWAEIQAGRNPSPTAVQAALLDASL